MRWHFERVGNDNGNEERQALILERKYSGHGQHGQNIQSTCQYHRNDIHFGNNTHSRQKQALPGQYQPG
jgi:hypothetical protein